MSTARWINLAFQSNQPQYFRNSLHIHPTAINFWLQIVNLKIVERKLQRKFNVRRRTKVVAFVARSSDALLRLACQQQPTPSTAHFHSHFPSSSTPAISLRQRTVIYLCFVVFLFLYFAFDLLWSLVRLSGSVARRQRRSALKSAPQAHSSPLTDIHMHTVSSCVGWRLRGLSAVSCQ